MRTNLLFIALAALASGPATAQNTPHTAFACDLYQAVKGDPGNLFFSPLSISTALAMTWAGARGETAAEMATVLHFTGDPGPIHGANSALLGDLATSEDDPYQLAIANRLWPDASLPLLPSFLELTGKFYHAQPEALDYAGANEEARQTINRWAEASTGGMIRNLLHKGDLTYDTLMVLTNAVFFKASWENAFDAALTTDQPFLLPDGKAVEVPFMTQKGAFAYAHLAGAQVLQMPYAGSNLAFVAILPDRADGLAQLEAALDPATLDEWMSSLAETNLDLMIPRFEMTWRGELRPILQAMGMQLAFGAGADFSAMTPARIFISQVIHQARIQVTEEGTEAAAATAVIMRKSARPVFRADHPFLFLIRDTKSGAILFMGRVVEPGE